MICLTSSYDDMHSWLTCTSQKHIKHSIPSTVVRSVITEMLAALAKASILVQESANPDSLAL